MSTSADILKLAAQYYETGNFSLAEQYAASLVDDEPNNAGALFLLGLISRQKGKPQDAIVFLNRSLTANGSNALAWQQAGDILLAGGDLPGGITYYEQALRLRPDYADGHLTLGVALDRVGQLPRALACFQRAAQLAPSSVAAHNHLGSALSRLGKWGGAAAAYENALKLAPDDPEIVYNLGNAHFNQGAVADAIACYRSVLERKPTYLAEVCSSLGIALRKQGDYAEAVAQFQEALRLRPGHGQALYNLSQLAEAGHHVFTPAELAQAKDVLASGKAGDVEKTLCAAAIANVLHLQGNYAEAFRHHQVANDLRWRFAKKRSAAYNAESHKAQVDSIIADHGPTYFELVKPWGTATEVPIFLVGMPGSGVALLEDLLCCHPHVRSAGDAGSLLRFFSQLFPDRTAANTSQLLPDIRVARTAAGYYLEHLAQLTQGAARVLVSSLDNVLSLGIFATLFRGARVIRCRRDPLDLGLSCYRQNPRDLAVTCSLEDIGTYYRTDEKLLDHWAQVAPLRFYDVNYEQLCQGPESTMRALLAFCGLDWDERCSQAVRAPITTDLPGQAEHYRAHLSPLIAALERR